MPPSTERNRPQAEARSTRRRETAETCRRNNVWWYCDRVATVDPLRKVAVIQAESTDKIVQFLDLCG